MFLFLFYSAAFQREGDREVSCGGERAIGSSDVLLLVLRGALTSSTRPLRAQCGTEARAAGAEPHVRRQHKRADRHQFH